MAAPIGSGSRARPVDSATPLLLASASYTSPTALNERAGRVEQAAEMTELDDPRDSVLQDVLDAVPALAGQRRTVSELPGGLTNANYKVVTDAGAYVVRRWSSDTGLLAIDRDNEYENSVRAAAVGVGAEVIAYLPEQNTMVFEFIEGQTMSEEDLRSGSHTERVADGVPAAARRAAFPGRLQHVRDSGALPADRQAARLPAARALRGLRTAACCDAGGAARFATRERFPATTICSRGTSSSPGSASG